MYQFRKIFKTDVINLFTNPMWIFYATLFPFLLILTLGFLTSGSYGTTVSSYDYYGVTMMIYGALNTATLAANSFMENRIKSANMRLVYSPVHPFKIYFSKILATFVFTTVCYTAVGIVLHFLLNVNFGGTSVFYIWLFMLALEFFSASLAIMMCCLLKSEEAVNQVLSNLITLLALLGGLFFPINGFGKIMRAVSNISPVKWVYTVILQVIYDSNFSLYAPTFICLIALSVVCTLLCAKFFKTEEYL